jgi:hypothetical protein
MRVATIQHLEERPQLCLLGLDPLESVIINKGHPRLCLRGLDPSESVIINKDHMIRFNTNHIPTPLHTVGLRVMRVTKMPPITMMEIRKEKQ